MGIRLSPQHGVNLAVFKCYFCLEDVGVAMFGMLRGDAEAPRNVVIDKKPCGKCAELMAQGIILISVRNGEAADNDNPYRTGGWVVVKEEALRRAIDAKTADVICRLRYAFVPDEAWATLGLPPVTGGH